MNFSGWGKESTRELLKRGSMDKPMESVHFPTSQNVGNQIQQLRVSTTPTPVSTLRVPRVQNSVPTVPKPVQNIRIRRTPIAGTDNVRVHVSFLRDPADTAFQSANVFLRQGSGNSNHNIVGVTSGTQTSFVVPKSTASSVVTVQSVGTGNAVPIENSPSAPVNLG